MAEMIYIYRLVSSYILLHHDEPCIRTVLYCSNVYVSPKLRTYDGAQCTVYTRWSCFLRVLPTRIIIGASESRKTLTPTGTPIFITYAGVCLTAARQQGRDRGQRTRGFAEYSAETPDNCKLPIHAASDFPVTPGSRKQLHGPRMFSLYTYYNSALTFLMSREIKANSNLIYDSYNILYILLYYYYIYRECLYCNP